jgi:hypothetical protein
MRGKSERDSSGDGDSERGSRERDEKKGERER